MQLQELQLHGNLQASRVSGLRDHAVLSGQAAVAQLGAQCAAPQVSHRHTGCCTCRLQHAGLCVTCEVSVCQSSAATPSSAISVQPCR